MRILRSSVLLVLVAVGFSACKRQPPQPNQGPVEIYNPVEGAVGIDVIPAGSTDDSATWIASYSDAGLSTKFGIELMPSPFTDENVAAGKGRFVAKEESEALPLLQALAPVLKAKHIPSKIEKAQAVPFDFTVVRQKQTRFPDGSYNGTPPGNWALMQVALAGGKAEFFLSINPRTHKAEFSMKDAADGDAILAALAKVF